MKKLPLAWNLACNIYVRTKILSCKSQREHPKKHNMAHISAKLLFRFRQIFFIVYISNMSREDLVPTYLITHTEMCQA